MVGLFRRAALAAVLALASIAPSAALPPPDAYIVIPQTVSPLGVSASAQSLAQFGVSNATPIHFTVLINYGTVAVCGRGDSNPLSASAYTFQIPPNGGSYTISGNPLGYQLMCAGACPVAIQIFN